MKVGRARSGKGSKCRTGRIRPAKGELSGRRRRSILLLARDIFGKPARTSRTACFERAEHVPGRAGVDEHAAADDRGAVHVPDHGVREALAAGCEIKKLDRWAVGRVLTQTELASLAAGRKKPPPACGGGVRARRHGDCRGSPLAESIALILGLRRP
jgi:hypothetical protein